MTSGLPPLAEWLRWAADRPAPFRAEPEGFANARVIVRAVVSDLFETRFGAAPDKSFLLAFVAEKRIPVERNRLGWVLAVCHVLAHPSLDGRRVSHDGVVKFLLQEIPGLAPVAPISGFDADEERREELVRRTLRAAGLRLTGESANDAEDRLKQVDSVERHRVLEAAAEREKRAREVRDAMAKKAAEEAAAKVSRE